MLFYYVYDVGDVFPINILKVFSVRKVETGFMVKKLKLLEKCMENYN